MTLGLAVGDDDAIYGAEDSFGTTDSGMPRKLVVLDNMVMLLTAGGMDHWRDALSGFSPSGTVLDIATSLAERLDHHMNEHNQAFGLVCGFENGRPCCYRLNRFVGDSHFAIVEEDLRLVQPIGCPEGVDPHVVAVRALERINAGEPRSSVLLREISAQLFSSEVAEPIREERLERP